MKQQREYPLWYIMIKLLKLVLKKSTEKATKRNIQSFTYYHFLTGYFLEVSTLANRASKVRALHKGSIWAFPRPISSFTTTCATYLGSVCTEW